MWDELRLLNPWWESSSAWNEIPSEFHRDAFSGLVRILGEVDREPGVLLTGFRRIGKTVLVKQVMRYLHREWKLPVENLLYVDFQEDTPAGFEPREIVERALERRQAPHPCLVVFDEVHFVEDWDKKLRGILHAHGGKELILLATGSGTSQLRRATGDVLLDRVRDIRLGPMTFGEWLRRRGLDSEASLPALYERFRRYQVDGGFPGLIGSESDHAVRNRLRRLCEQRVIDGDLVRRLGIRRRVSFGHLWRHFALHPGEILDWSTLPSDFMVSKQTLEGWVHALAQAEMIVEIHPSQPSGLPLSGRKKYSRVYPVDHALSHAYGVSTDSGQFLEAMVLRQLRDLVQKRDSSGLATHLTHWRDDKRSGPNEIDFRVTGPGVSYLIEVKGTKSPSRKELARVAAIAKHLAHDRAVLAYGGTERLVERREVKGVPIEVHVWPIPLLLLALDRGDPHTEVLFDVDRNA